MDSNSFLDLSLQGVLILQHVDQLSVVDLEQHASDLASQVREHPLDEREEPLTQHLLLFLWRSSCQHGGSQRFLSLDKHSLLWRWSSSRGNHLSRHNLSRWVPGSGGVLEALLRSDLLGSHGDWGHARASHHGHGLRSGLTHWGARSSCHAGTGAWSSGHSHAWHTSWARNSLLLRPSWLSSDLSRGEESLRLRHGGHEVATHSHLLHAAHLLHAHACHALDVLTGQVCFTVLPSLSKSHVERLGHNDATIHLCHSFGCFLGRGEAHEPKSLRATLFVHHLSGSNGSVRGELLSKSLIINGVIQILHIQVHSLVSVQPLELQLLKLFLQFLLSLSLLLGPAHVQVLPNISTPLSSSTAFSADSESSKDTNPNPLFFPDSSAMISAPSACWAKSFSFTTL